jgi:integrase
MKITAKTVATAVLPEGKTDVILFDDTLTGFGLRVRESADKVRKQFIVQYRAAGVMRRMLLGSADVIGVEAARAAAKKALGAVAVGGDPQGDKEANRSHVNVFTFSTLAKQYLDAKAKSLRPRTLVESVRYLTGDYFKPLHNMPVERITRRDVASQVLRIANESGGRTGVRARSALSAMFVWAMQQGLAESNPVAGTAQPETNGARERVLSDAELAAIWNAAGDSGDFGKVVRLLMLTGTRRNEVGAMCWSELNGGGAWTIPAARAKNKRQHTLPLSALAQSIIESVPERVGRDLLFGERSKLGFCGWDNAKDRLDARLGKTVAHWTLHDLRRTAATRMADLGVQPHIIEAALNHQSGHKRGVAGIYNRSSYEREVRAALALWADHICTITAGGERKVLAFSQDRT